ncbi:CoA transferase [Paracoccus sp. 11-3]|uniref:CoA transferase n=1 Tax=Paracoccus amoyensis TaxID=2760093 RepID=A0A926GGG4_9RHOB|nr:CaiB/BaiF CoA-transferase family protein [Paracoccus amoyensis]MBC9248161.1 CoA transferase [Paracoccus amoyensis]
MVAALQGIRIVEFAGIGPTPFAAMWFAEHGAQVIRIVRPDEQPVLGPHRDLLNRGRDWIELDLKRSEDKAAARELVLHADALIEGMRPGVMERLGLGPSDFSANPKLVYGRMTGWGQSGPLAETAGHDITYLAITGALHAIGPATHPIPPLNLLGDFAGGSMYLVSGMLAAMLRASRTGRGQVVDAAITDGVAHLMTMISGLRLSNLWTDRRQVNLLDGGAPYYTVYRCADGGFLAVGAIEPKFWTRLLSLLGIAPDSLPDRADPDNWPAIQERLAQVISQRSRDEWAEIMESEDACAAPVLSIDEAPRHPHNIARRTFSGYEPMPAPRLSATPARVRDGEEISAEVALQRWL